MADLVLRNGNVYTPSGLIKGGLAVSDGIITHIGSDASLPDAARVSDVQGRYVLPGLIDPHGIFGRVDWTPTARQESVHAAVNGVTLIITYVQMGDLTAPKRLPVHAEARELCERESFVDFKFNAAIGTEDQIAEIPDLVADGVHSFNFWMNLSKLEREQYGFPGLDWGFLYRACEVIAECGPPAFASVHCEEPEIIHTLYERAARTGRQDLATWAATRPSFTEGAHAFTAGLIGHELGVPISLVHIAAPETLDAIRYLRGRGATVHSETCPQYLTLGPEDDLGLVGKQMPPLRDRSYQDAMWKAVRDGTISMIASDHQIAKRADKEVEGGLWGEPTDASGSGGGLTGSIAPIMLSEGVNKNRIGVDRFVQLCSENPAKIYSIYPRKGAIAPGSDADLIVVDINREWTMSSESLRSSSDFCLWDGWKVRGKVVQTYVRGDLVAEDGELVADTPNGSYVGS
jgi:dihydroorotase-like cyclic amidohydrolase